MTAPIVALPISAANGGITKKKRVLLLDTSQTKRDLRADVMRKLGIEVDCAADVVEARCWWRADLYNLVSINASAEGESRGSILYRYSRCQSNSANRVLRGKSSVSGGHAAF